MAFPSPLSTVSAPRPPRAFPRLVPESYLATRAQAAVEFFADEVAYGTTPLPCDP